jgi:hypothetical protein
MIDVGKDGEILSQRSKGENLTKYAADHPVLPLSETAEEGMSICRTEISNAF